MVDPRKSEFLGEVLAKTKFIFHFYLGCVIKLKVFLMVFVCKLQNPQSFL